MLERVEQSRQHDDHVHIQKHGIVENDGATGQMPTLLSVDDRTETMMLA
jgi:hypothetical protein